MQRFTARLEKGDLSLGWTVVRVPFDPAEVWPKRLRQRVRGTINGFAFRSSLLPDTSLGGLIVLVNKAMQSGGQVALGAEAEFVLEPDLEARPISLPDELDVLLDDAEGLRAFYEALSETARRQLGQWIEDVKSEASRIKRAEQTAERLLNTMEAEMELPPAILNAFRARPKAKAGWPRLTETQRRGELMGVFYYQSPESRAKRIQKLCDLAEKKA
ncbi:YdeI/OmpD-associated family protein [Granulicella cerasi]|uniref:YdeI/OmpD-associated family protein n=1 Tax=Granulicella cerasi TaxID=741063 RepID=A0ABW1Z3A0_9BACT|nr:YdeI/OmpD-associated family protein [Granulicella cerasi]